MSSWGRKERVSPSASLRMAQQQLPRVRVLFTNKVCHRMSLHSRMWGTSSEAGFRASSQACRRFGV